VEERYKILQCKCGWLSKPLSKEDLVEMGVPWYCDDCGERVSHFIDGPIELLEPVYKKHKEKQ